MPPEGSVLSQDAGHVQNNEWMDFVMCSRRREEEIGGILSGEWDGCSSK